MTTHTIRSFRMVWRHGRPPSLVRRFDFHHSKTQSIGIYNNARPFGNTTAVVSKSTNQKISIPPSTPRPPSPVLPLWIVKHPSTVAVVPIIGNLAYFSIASGFLCTDVISLRLLLICGYSGLVTFHALRPRPLMIPLGWSAFFVMVNVSMVTMLIMDEMPPTLTKEEEDLHVMNFAPLTRSHFRALMDISERVTYPHGALLTQANKPCRKLHFILSGTADMSDANGKHTSWLRRGQFANCMRFQRAGWDSTKLKHRTTAYGTIRCEGEVECLVWNDQELLRLLDASPNDDMRLRMNHVVIEAIIGRLLNDTEGANVKDYIRVIAQGWADNEVKQVKIKAMATERIDETVSESSPRNR